MRKTTIGLAALAFVALGLAASADERGAESGKVTRSVSARSTYPEPHSPVRPASIREGTSSAHLATVLEPMATS